MSTQSLVKKIEEIKLELLELKKPKSILGKLYIDSKMLQKAKKILFDFDIEKFVSKQDLKLPIKKKWKK